MEKSFKFRIYPNESQRKLIANTFGCTRFVWNHFLARKEEAFKQGEKGLGFATLCLELTQLKKEKPWLKEVDSTALERIGKKPTLMDLNGHPKFKRKRDNRKSYTSGSNKNIAVLERYIKLPKLGLVRYRDQRMSVDGRILSATVIENGNVPQTGKSVGIDLGIKEFAITSDGDKKANPRFLKKRLKKLKSLQRALSRKTIGGKRWEKNRLKIAKLWEKIRNSRLDFQQKYSSELIKSYDVICLETLAVENMMKNHRVAQAIGDVAWRQFVEILSYKAKWYDKEVIRIDTFFASSQICSICGEKNPEVKDLKVREWTCSNCGTHHDRDVNAAKNILAEGLKRKNNRGSHGGSLGMQER